MRGSFTLVLALLLATPLGAASDPLRDQLCNDEGVHVCFGPGTCTDVGCVPRSCQPLAHCRSTLIVEDECGVNMSNDGETCQVVVGGELRTNDPQNEVKASVVLTDGNIDTFNLPNTWVAPSVEVLAHSDDINVGDLAVGFYASNITMGDHEWRHVGIIVYHGPGFVGSQDATVGVYLLDDVPESCYVRSTTPASVDAECPEANAGEILGPLLP